MKVGDYITRLPVTVGSEDVKALEKTPMRGRVVYIHPEERFYVLQFEHWKREAFL